MTPQAKKPAAPAFRAPDAFRGMKVLWKPDVGEDKDNCLAFVTGVHGDGQVDLAVMVAGSSAVWPKTGVRHNDDPDRERIRNAASGVWEIPPEDKEFLGLLVDLGNQVRGLADIVAQQAERMAQLEGKLATLAGQKPAGGSRRGRPLAGEGEQAGDQAAAGEAGASTA